jgi:hypothetical protein
MGRVGPTDFAGITSADALDAGDQVGTALAISVPTSGRIERAMLFDPSDQGIDADVWLFSANPTLAASDAAFALSDAVLATVVGVLHFIDWEDAANGQVSQADNATSKLPFKYTAPTGVLYAALKTLGTPTYTTPAWPALSMEIV